MECKKKDFIDFDVNNIIIVSIYLTIAVCIAYFRHGWNFNVLSQNPLSVLRHLGPIPGKW